MWLWATLRVGLLLPDVSRNTTQDLDGREPKPMKSNITMSEPEPESEDVLNFKMKTREQQKLIRPTHANGIPDPNSKNECPIASEIRSPPIYSKQGRVISIEGGARTLLLE